MSTFHHSLGLVGTQQRSTARLVIAISLAFAGLVLTSGGGWWLYRSIAQGHERRDVPQLQEQTPRMYMESTTLDLGNISLDAGEFIPTSFRYENRGAAPLVISDVVATCSCTSAEATRKVTPPGESGEIRVQLRRSGIGSGGATLLIYSNDPDRRKLELRCEWNGITRMNFTPQAVNFGDVQPGVVQERTLTFSFSDQERFPQCQSMKVKCSAELEIKPESAGFFQQPLQPVSRFKVRLKPGRQLGEARGQVIYSFGGCFKNEFVIPVTWNVRTRVQMTPSQLYVQSRKSGSAVQKKLIVSASRPDTLVIGSVQVVPAGAAKASIRKISDICSEIELSVPFNEQAPLVTGSIRVECLKPVLETIEVPWSAVMLQPEQSLAQ